MKQTISSSTSSSPQFTERMSRKLTGRQVLLTAVLLALWSMTVSAQPGDAYPAASSLSDQKLGSVLIYNYYTSSSTNGSQNTRFNVTNHGSATAYVHLFLIDGASCTVADTYNCLDGKGQFTFNATDFDPGITGYAIVVAVSSAGCPLNYNFLSGSAWIKTASGHQAGLPAETIAAIGNPGSGCTAASASATLLFDGTMYNRLPYSLAADRIRSTADGNDTRLILNRLSGNLGATMNLIGSFQGTLYDNSGTGLGFTSTAGCQLLQTLNDSFLRTSPAFSAAIGAGQTGWLRVGDNTAVPLTGATLNFNANAGSNPSAFKGGQNLRHLALTSFASITMPVRNSNCD